MARVNRGYAQGIDWFEVGIKASVVLLMAALIGGLGYIIYYEVNDPGHGQVTSKKWEGAYYSTSCSGNPIVCSTSYTPECYRINYNDGHHPGDACVSPEEFDYYEVGSYYPKGWKP